MKVFIKKLLLSSLYLTGGIVLIGCGNDDRTTISHVDPVIQEEPVVEKSPLVGIWSAPAYGRVYEFAESGELYISSLYHLTQNYCVKGDEHVDLSKEDLMLISRGDDLTSQVEIIEAGEDNIPGVTYQRIDELPELCTEEISVVKGQPNYEFNPALDLQIFWETFNELYLDFSLSDTDWNEVYIEANTLLPEVETEEDLFELFSYMIEPLEDAHNILIRGDLSHGVRQLVEDDEVEDNFSVSSKDDYETILFMEYALQQEWQQSLTNEQWIEGEEYVEEQLDLVFENILEYADDETIKTAADENFVWFITEENIGYLYINSMSEFSDEMLDTAEDVSITEAVIDEVLVDMQAVDGLIVDVRFNDGGSDAVSMALTSRFIDQSTHVYSMQARLGVDKTPLVDVYAEPKSTQPFLRPVVILTSASTISAAEVFVLSMKNLPNVTLIGEATLGAFSTILDSRVTSDIAFGFSNQFYYDSEGNWYEYKGIPADISVPFITLEQRVQEVDYAIEKALELL